MRPHPFASSLALGLALAASSGCDSSRPGAGLTNPNAGSATARDKASVRDDLAVPDGNAGNKEPVAESASSSPSSTGTNAGTGGPGGGQSGAEVRPGPGSDARQVSPEAATSPTASPPRKENSGNARGETRPDGAIKDGTPRSPQ